MTDITDLSHMLDRLDREYQFVKDERTRLLALITKCFPSVLAAYVASESGWDKKSGWVVYIKLPTGQVSWRIKDDERGLFDHLLVTNINPYDGHDVDTKWQRIAEFLKQ